MEERNNCLVQIKTEMKQRLKNERLNNRSTYLQTIKNLILQSKIIVIINATNFIRENYFIFIPKP